MSSIASPREIRETFAENRVSDLADPRCEQHERAATFVIETDGPDGPERSLTCDRCLADELRLASMRCYFPPPAVTALNLELYRAWAVAA